MNTAILNFLNKSALTIEECQFLYNEKRITSVCSNGNILTFEPEEW